MMMMVIMDMSDQMKSMHAAARPASMEQLR